MRSRTTSPYKNHRFPPEIIAHAVWLYHRFSLSFREVEELLAELEAPQAHGFVADDDSTFGQEFLDFAEAQTEAVVEPHRVGDYFGREPMILIGTCGTRTHASVTAYETALWQVPR